MERLERAIKADPSNRDAIVNALLCRLIQDGDVYDIERAARSEHIKETKIDDAVLSAMIASPKCGKALYEATCARGRKSLLDAASRAGRTDFLDWAVGSIACCKIAKDVAPSAARCGSVPVYKWCAAKDWRAQRPWLPLMKRAAKHGHLDLVRHFVDECDCRDVDETVWRAMIANGQIEVTRWFIDRAPKAWKRFVKWNGLVKSLDKALGKGHLAMLEFASTWCVAAGANQPLADDDHRETLKLVAWHLRRAIDSGRLDVVEWVAARLSPSEIKDACVGKIGDVAWLRRDVFAWVVARLQPISTKRLVSVLDDIIRHERHDLLEHMVDYSPRTRAWVVDGRAGRAAARFARVDTLKRIYGLEGTPFTREIPLCAAHAQAIGDESVGAPFGRPNPEWASYYTIMRDHDAVDKRARAIITLLVDTFEWRPTQKHILAAIRSWRPNTLNCLLDYQKAPQEAAIEAVRAGSMETLRVLALDRYDRTGMVAWTDPQLCTEAAANGRRDILEWLRFDRRCPWKTADVLKAAVDHPELLRWIVIHMDQ